MRDGEIVASHDTLFSPEAVVYDPPDAGRGTYHVRVCDFGDGHPWDAPRTYSGEVTFSPVSGGASLYPPEWKVFPAYGEIGAQTHPWSYPSTDIREIWCWESTVGSPPVTLPECDREVQNLASRAPWDHNVRTNTPTFTTMGNNAHSAEAWTGPLTPGATAYRPVSLQREYIYPWTNSWHEASPVADTSPATSGARNLDDTAAFTPGVYEFLAHAPGYGHVRFRLTLAAGQNRTVVISTVRRSTRERRQRVTASSTTSSSTTLRRRPGIARAPCPTSPEAG